MFIEVGTVFRIDQGIVRIMIDRKQACVGCHMCHNGKDGTYMIAKAKDLMGVSIGDVVRIESSIKVSPVKAGFILYIIPILLLILGYFLGKTLTQLIGIDLAGESSGIISGFSLMGLAYLVIYLLTHKGKQHDKIHFNVVEIIRRLHRIEG